MKLPRRFFQPLAMGAPPPYRELPARLERMIHFIPPHNQKVRAKLPELIRQVDVVLGNGEKLRAETWSRLAETWSERCSPPRTTR